MVSDKLSESDLIDDTAWLKQTIISLGFSDIGVADVEGGISSAKYAKEFQKAGDLKAIDYLDNSIDKRCDINKWCPGTKRVVMVALNYFTGDHKDFIDISSQKRAKIARYCWGKDYHNFTKKKLIKFAKRFRAFLLEKYGDEVSEQLICKGFCDTSPVLERAWAQKAGIGFIGKSGMFIHRNFGTWTFLAGFATNYPFIVDQPFYKNLCGSCERCLEACPAKALKPYKVDINKCLTTWNIERPFIAGAKDKIKGHGWAAGCDICQEVCPWNKFQQLSDEQRFQPIDDHIAVTFDKVPKNLSGTALARAKFEYLKKNTAAALDDGSVDI